MSVPQVVIVGRPNVGKSSVLNWLAGVRIAIADMDNLTRHIEDQINLAIDSADVILFVVDTRDGMLPLDQDVARRLRSVTVPIIPIANKTDDERFDSQTDEF